MRIVAGIYRSRRLEAPRGLATRPTSDRLRETLFNVLTERLPGARFADLYAGSGAVGLEALSRGAAFCCFAEHSPAAAAAIRANLKALAVPTETYRLEPRGVAALLGAAPRESAGWDVVFLDPPYEADEEYTRTLGALARSGALLAPGAIVVAEHSRKHPPPEACGGLRRYRLLEQGDAALSFYNRIEA